MNTKFFLQNFDKIIHTLTKYHMWVIFQLSHWCHWDGIKSAEIFSDGYFTAAVSNVFLRDSNSSGAMLNPWTCILLVKEYNFKILSQEI